MAPVDRLDELQSLGLLEHAHLHPLQGLRKLMSVHTPRAVRIDPLKKGLRAQCHGVFVQGFNHLILRQPRERAVRDDVCRLRPSDERGSASHGLGLGLVAPLHALEKALVVLALEALWGLPMAPPPVLARGHTAVASIWVLVRVRVWVWGHTTVASICCRLLG